MCTYTSTQPVIQRMWSSSECIGGRWPSTMLKLRWICVDCCPCLHIGYDEPATEPPGLLTYHPYVMYMQDISAKYHAIRSDEVVVDHRHGGRIKWAQDPLALENTYNIQVGIMTLIMRPISLHLYTENRCPGYARR